jgi:hypothetical protein
MYKTLGTFVAALMLTVSTAASAQTAVDATGRVVRIDPGAQMIILDSNQAFRVTPNTVLFVDNRPVALGTLQPGQTVVIRSGEAVAMMPSGSPVTAQTPGSTTTVVAMPSASPGLAQQTVYGQITDVDTGKVKIKTAEDDFHVKVPPEVATQLRKGDAVRVDLTFRPTR